MKHKLLIITNLILFFFSFTSKAETPQTYCARINRCEILSSHVNIVPLTATTTGNTIRYAVIPAEN